MSTDVKLSKDQLYEIIQLDGFFGSWLGKLGKKGSNRPCYYLC